MELFLTGKILKPRGLKGEVKVELITDFPDHFVSRSCFYVGTSPLSVVPLQVTKAALRGGFAWLFFDGIDTFEKATALVGSSLFITKDELAPQPENRAYVHEIVGMRVVDGNGTLFGTVTDVLPMPAHDVYEVSRESKTILLPAVEAFVESFDLATKTIVMPRCWEFV